MDKEKVMKAFAECLCKGHDFCAECYQKGPGLGFVCKNNVCLDVLLIMEVQRERIELKDQVIKEQQREIIKLGGGTQYS